MKDNHAITAVGIVVILGSVWGLSECVLGAAVQACASRISGSVMTGVALFFMAAAWAVVQKAWCVALLVGIASLFKMFDALLLSLPLGNGAISHPVFAFVLEGAAFLALAAIAAGKLGRKPAGRAVWGGGAALISAAAFPLVRTVTGTAACLAPGTGIPLAWYYAPLAVGLSAVLVPLGIRAGEKAAGLGFKLRFFEPSLAVVLALTLMAVVRQL